MAKTSHKATRVRVTSLTQASHLHIHTHSSTMSEVQKEAPSEPVAMDTSPEETKPVEETWEDIPEEIMALGADEVNSRIRLIENDIKVRTMFCICLITRLNCITR